MDEELAVLLIAAAQPPLQIDRVLGFLVAIGADREADAAVGQRRHGPGQVFADLDGPAGLHQGVVDVDRDPVRREVGELGVAEQDRAAVPAQIERDALVGLGEVGQHVLGGLEALDGQQAQPVAVAEVEHLVLARRLVKQEDVVAMAAAQDLVAALRDQDVRLAAAVHHGGAAQVVLALAAAHLPARLDGPRTRIAGVEREQVVALVAAQDRAGRALSVAQLVVALAAAHVVEAGAGVEPVVSGPAPDHVVAVAGGDVVVPLAAMDEVVAAAGHERVVALAAAHVVVALAGGDGVVSFQAAGDVVAGAVHPVGVQGVDVVALDQHEVGRVAHLGQDRQAVEVVVVHRRLQVRHVDGETVERRHEVVGAGLGVPGPLDLLDGSGLGEDRRALPVLEPVAEAGSGDARHIGRAALMLEADHEGRGVEDRRLDDPPGVAAFDEGFEEARAGPVQFDHVFILRCRRARAARPSPASRPRAPEGRGAARVRRAGSSFNRVLDKDGHVNP